jgi:hypothetical protein
MGMRALPNVTELEGLAEYEEAHGRGHELLVRDDKITVEGAPDATHHVQTTCHMSPSRYNVHSLCGGREYPSVFRAPHRSSPKGGQ